MSLPGYEQLNEVPEYDVASDVYLSTLAHQDPEKTEWIPERLREIRDENLVAEDAGPSEQFESLVDRIVRVQGVRKWIADAARNGRVGMDDQQRFDAAAESIQQELYGRLERTVPAGYHLGFNPDNGGFRPKRQEAAGPQAPPLLGGM